MIKYFSFLVVIFGALLFHYNSFACGALDPGFVPPPSNAVTADPADSAWATVPTEVIVTNLHGSKSFKISLGGLQSYVYKARVYPATAQGPFLPPYYDDAWPPLDPDRLKINTQNTKYAVVFNSSADLRTFLDRYGNDRSQFVLADGTLQKDGKSSPVLLLTEEQLERARIIF